jgi:hypothetical protein
VFLRIPRCGKNDSVVKRMSWMTAAVATKTAAGRGVCVSQVMLPKVEQLNVS